MMLGLLDAMGGGERALHMEHLRAKCYSRESPPKLNSPASLFCYIIAKVFWRFKNGGLENA